MKHTVFFAAVAMFLFSCGQSVGNSNRSEAAEDQQKVLISTPYGDMTVVLFNETPQHRDNFIKLVEEGFYDGTLFHRVIEGFMIQGGDPHSRDAEPGEPLGRGGPGYTIPAEFHQEHFHYKGALSAARQGDQVNPERESSGSQFYIVQGRTYSSDELNVFEEQAGKQVGPERRQMYTSLGGAPHLDDEYTVFGRVLSGLEVIDKIAGQETDQRNRPVEDIAITMELID